MAYKMAYTEIKGQICPNIMKSYRSSKYIADLGEQLERNRLLQNIPQTELAQKAGISTRTLRRLESGEGGTLDSFIRLLIALNIDANLSMLIPGPTIRPMERVRKTKKERMRASGVRKSHTSNKESKWTWGDEKS